LGRILGIDCLAWLTFLAYLQLFVVFGLICRTFDGFTCMGSGIEIFCNFASIAFACFWVKKLLRFQGASFADKLVIDDKHLPEARLTNIFCNIKHFARRT
jgi:hypothetical protein